MTKQEVENLVKQGLTTKQFETFCLEKFILFVEFELETGFALIDNSYIALVFDKILFAVEQGITNGSLKDFDSEFTCLRWMNRYRDIIMSYFVENHINLTEYFRNKYDTSDIISYAFIEQVDLNKQKNLIIVSVILTVGVSGIYLFDAAFAGVSLAMVLGVILNLLLRD